MSFRLEKVVTVHGREVIFVQDEISPSSSSNDPILLEASNSEHDFIWVRESILSRIKKDNPKIPVYGLWQTLIASKLIDLKSPLYIWSAGSSPGSSSISGSYLVVDDGKAVDARSFIADLPADVSTPKEKAVYIQVTNLDGLVLPRISAVLPAERAQIKRLVRKKMAVTVGLLALVMVAITGAMDWYLETRSDRYVREAQALDASAAQLAQEATKALANADSILPEDRERTIATLTRLAEIQSRSIGFTLEESGFASDIWVAKVASPPIGLSFDVEISTEPGKTPSTVFSPAGPKRESQP